MNGNGPKSVRPDDEHSLNIFQSLVENPHTSLRTVTQQQRVYYNVVRNVLKDNSFKPYKIYLLAELQEDAFDRRMEFLKSL